MRRAVLTGVLAAAAVLGALPAGAAAESHVTSIGISGHEQMDKGYTRVYGIVTGVVDGDEPVRGLPPEGLTYTTEFELIRPKTGFKAKELLVEAENRGNPLLFNALTGDPDSTGKPSAITYRPSDSRFLAANDLAYARVQWQTGVSAGVPSTAQGVGEVIMRDFARYWARRYPRRALVGVSQGAFFADTFLAEGFNALPSGGRAYGQALTVDGNGNWMTINQLAGSDPQNPYLRPDGRPLAYSRMLRRPKTDPQLLDVANYTDFYRLRAGLTDVRKPPRGVHRYDWPSPHQSFDPAAIFGGFGCNGGVEIPLNPIDNTPYLRALVQGMAAGRVPPSKQFELGPAPATSPGFNGLDGVAVRVPKIDSAGLPVGGVRFPELDYPLGALTPPALSPSVTTSQIAVCGNSGGFAPYPPAKIAKRFTQKQYIAAYGAQLLDLAGDRYLRLGDRLSMFKAAAANYEAATAPPSQ